MGVQQDTMIIYIKISSGVTNTSAIISHLSCTYEGRNNDVLDQFGWNLIVKEKMEGIMVGL